MLLCVSSSCDCVSRSSIARACVRDVSVRASIEMWPPPPKNSPKRAPFLGKKDDFSSFEFTLPSALSLSLSLSLSLTRTRSFNNNKKKKKKKKKLK